MYQNPKDQNPQTQQIKSQEKVQNPRKKLDNKRM
jgi:hypothetical protein